MVLQFGLAEIAALESGVERRFLAQDVGADPLCLALHLREELLEAIALIYLG